MTAAGYSGTPLAAKLGVKGGTRALLVAAPSLPGLEPPPDAVVHRRRGRGAYDVVVLFVADVASLRTRFTPLIAALTTAGALWVCWPKRASKVATDLDENVVREHGLATGLVDVKVAAIDATWSALKFVRRKADR
ncbi:MAG TPA: hypothetical protein VKQ07_05425 [Jatrophihabitantaceae bacterium]|nr:hypothetical protein [Jatrophihabitantaceae bacterium]